MLITDRVKSDVDYAFLYMKDVKNVDNAAPTADLKGCYNIADLNRVIRYVSELDSSLKSNYNINLNLERLAEIKANDDILTKSFYDKYLKNINKICEFLKINNVQSVLDFNSANFIEESLRGLEKVIDVNSNTFNRLNSIMTGGA